MPIESFLMENLILFLIAINQYYTPCAVFEKVVYYKKPTKEGNLMKINVYYKQDHPCAVQIENAVSALNTVQRFFFFSVIRDDGKVLDGSEIDPITFLEKHAPTRVLHQNLPRYETYPIFITERKFNDNWFSHETRTNSIITTVDWEQLYSPPSLKAFIMYQCAQAALGFVADLDETIAMNFIHYNPKGCMFDLCQSKKEIKLGMASGAICSACKATLQQYGTDTSAIEAAERILEYVRCESIGKPTVIENSAFVVMRFTENDENDHVYKYGIKTAFEELGIDQIRADSRMATGPILKKIVGFIKRRRFIVVKVDEPNLNVFYELGLAMGLDKDVLLISEEKLVLDLPSDLKNLECLTYPAGNYDKLKEKIVRFYNDNYHLG